MYGKIFETIYNSSIAEDWQTRLVFMDLIVLADTTGTIDMTQEAIARRTNVPIEIVKQAIATLEGPDPRSRNPEAKGVRIVRLDDHRDWGWFILNHKHYMNMVDMEEYRRQNRERQARYRERHKNVDGSKDVSGDVSTDNVSVTGSNGPVTQSNYTETETETETEKTYPLPGPKPSDVLRKWNELAARVGLPKCLKLSDERVRHLETRLSEPSFKDGLDRLFELLADSPFLTGDNDRKWVATFDWLIKNDGNYLKVLEGKYTKSETGDDDGWDFPPPEPLRPTSVEGANG